jgi:prepilin-type N-terminal cleavage/methylation domain-containing protein
MKTKRGFTLLELLVVIGIIAILLGFAAVSFAAAQKKARDARRREDLKSIQNALEQYYAENSFVYPVDCSDASTYISGGSWPQDPVAGSSYTEACAAASYTVTATLEQGGTFSVSNLQ